MTSASVARSASVVRDPASTGVPVEDVGPLARVLEVVHVVPEIREPEILT
jgi:hypothetical protein